MQIPCGAICVPPQIDSFTAARKLVGDIAHFLHHSPREVPSYFVPYEQREAYERELGFLVKRAKFMEWHLDGFCILLQEIYMHTMMNIMHRAKCQYTLLQQRSNPGYILSFEQVREDSAILMNAVIAVDTITCWTGSKDTIEYQHTIDPMQNSLDHWMRTRQRFPVYADEQLARNVDGYPGLHRLDAVNLALLEDQCSNDHSPSNRSTIASSCLLPTKPSNDAFTGSSGTIPLNSCWGLPNFPLHIPPSAQSSPNPVSSSSFITSLVHRSSRPPSSLFISPHCTFGNLSTSARMKGKMRAETPSHPIVPPVPTILSATPPLMIQKRSREEVSPTSPTFKNASATSPSASSSTPPRLHVTNALGLSFGERSRKRVKQSPSWRTVPMVVDEEESEVDMMLKRNEDDTSSPGDGEFDADSGSMSDYDRTSDPWRARSLSLEVQVGDIDYACSLETDKHVSRLPYALAPRHPRPFALPLGSRTTIGLSCGGDKNEVMSEWTDSSSTHYEGDYTPSLSDEALSDDDTMVSASAPSTKASQESPRWTSNANRASEDELWEDVPRLTFWWRVIKDLLPRVW